MWPTLTFICVAALVVLHLWWRKRYSDARKSAELANAALVARAERQMSALVSQQESWFNSMSEGVLLLDHNGRIQFANRAFLDLFTVPGEILGRTILEVLRQHELIDLLDQVRDEGAIRGCEFRLAGPEERILEVNGATLQVPESGGHRTILVFHDLTRLKRLERTRQEFVANVSHELRTPLSLITGYVETLLGGAKDNPELSAKFLQTIQRNAERLQFLIEDLLIISELESGRVSMNLQPVALNEIAQRVLGDYESQAAARKITLLNEMGALRASADPNRLQQVFGNLVGNAIKYGRDQGTVRLSARENDEGLEISVSDDGPGIPEPALERVFERFFRVDKGRSREQGGTGLGLSIVKHIVQSHGGKVWARSESGKGATICFTLPRAN